MQASVQCRGMTRGTDVA